MTYAAGNIYLASEEGVVHIFRAGPRFERIAEIDMGEGIFASPVFSEGRLYLRTTRALYCIDASPSQAGG